MDKYWKNLIVCLFAALLLQIASEDSFAVEANDFNPYMHDTLPKLRSSSSESRNILNQLGAKETSLQKEAGHRLSWKEELYPVVYGDKTAHDEIIVMIDFANPESEKIWQVVAQAAGHLSPKNAKIVVFGNNGEYFGTDLTGFGIWVAANRPQQGLSYFSYALHRWNEVKQKQKKTGSVKRFNTEYDATLLPSDEPIHYVYMHRVKPAVPAAQELNVAKYSTNAGSVNQYQATQVAGYYGVKKLPAVIVNGNVMNSVSVDSILSQLK